MTYLVVNWRLSSSSWPPPPAHPVTPTSIPSGQTLHLFPPNPGLQSQAPVWLSHVVATEPCGSQWHSLQPKLVYAQKLASQTSHFFPATPLHD